MENDDINNGANCYFRDKMASMTIDWKPVHKKEADTSCNIKLLQKSGGKVLQPKIISSVAMGYIQSLKNNLIQIMGDKLVVFKRVNME